MVTVVHVYNRWSKSELRCYVNGEIVSSTDISWLVSTSDVSAINHEAFHYFTITVALNQSDVLFISVKSGNFTSIRRNLHANVQILEIMTEKFKRFNYSNKQNTVEQERKHLNCTRIAKLHVG